MKSSVILRRGIVLAAGTLVALTATLIVATVIFALLFAALDAGYLRRPFIRFLVSHAERNIRIDGPLKTRLLSLNPLLVAERVTIDNPPWTPAGTTAEIEKITVVFKKPAFGRSFGIQRLEMDGAHLSLMRDSTGHANWQPTNPDNGPESSLPLIGSLSMPGAHVALLDAYRHLRFNGTVTAEELRTKGQSSPLRIEGTGELNGRPVSFEIAGDPLAGANHARPYGFSFSERSSGSVLTGSGVLAQPFDFEQIDAKFEAAGEDLKDLYFLTGVTLVNTGKYRLSGKVSRRGAHTEFSNLAVASGQSDVLAKVVIETSKGRPAFEADLTSQVIRTADLGAAAAGREEDSEAGKLLLSTAMLSPRAMRHGDWKVRFRARRVDVRRVSLHGVSARLMIDKGIIVVDPLSAEVLGGKLVSRIRVDAKTDTPAADVDIKLTDVQIAQFDRKDAGPPPLEGALQARVNVTGHGRSIHEVAASASGPVTAVLTHGSIRTSLAELAGLDLRALGLILAKDKQETGIRCAVAAFEAHDGTLNAQRMVVDTEPVSITGEGQLHLDSESMDFALRGRPKSLRLFRLRAPLLVRGTLVHPAVSVQKGTIALVDPGLAKDTDCASLQGAAGRISAVDESGVNSKK